jgi:hypothetical protein
MRPKANTAHFQFTGLNRYDVLVLSLGQAMRRREFHAVLCGSVGWPLTARAQQPDRMRRLGVMVSGPTEADAEGQARVAALKLGLLERGWVA